MEDIMDALDRIERRLDSIIERLDNTDIQKQKQHPHRDRHTEQLVPPRVRNFLREVL